MNRNVGTADRVIRLALGLAIGGAGLYFQSWLGLIGLVFLGTALIGWCPAYLPFGLSTCRLQSQGE
jgi:hypothetical protein